MYKGRIIDCDMHHAWASDEELYPYLSSHWRELLQSAGPGVTLARPNGIQFSLPGGSNKKLDGYPSNGRPPGADYEWMRRQALDKFGVDYAMLTFDVGLEAGVANPYLAVELARAINDWNIDRWLDGRDKRLRGAVLVPTELPAAAAAEIRRVADHPRIIAVLLTMNTIGRPFGHPHYDPIYDAAVETGLPVCAHLGSELASRGRFSAAGNPGSRLEQFVANDQAGMHHLSSLLTHATFERFPRLRFLLTEWGFTWMPWLLWNLDDQFGLLRRENPRVTELPSDVFRRHVRASTQPFDHTDDRQQLVALLESFGGMDKILMFASDYPHWDGDEPTHIAARLPREWHDRIFYRNAAEFFGLDDAGAEQAPGKQALRS